MQKRQVSELFVRFRACVVRFVDAVGRRNELALGATRSEIGLRACMRSEVFNVVGFSEGRQNLTLGERGL